MNNRNANYKNSIALADVAFSDLGLHERVMFMEINFKTRGGDKPYEIDDDSLSKEFDMPQKAIKKTRESLVKAGYITATINPESQRFVYELTPHQWVRNFQVNHRQTRSGAIKYIEEIRLILPPNICAGVVKAIVKLELGIE